MRYENIVEGRFIKRINRFIAEVEIDGKVQRVHVKNTGRCKELFIEGATIYLEKSNNPNRKTAYSLISIYKGNQLINIDSQVPNDVVAKSIQQGLIDEIGQVDFLKREVTYGKSRFDIYYKKGEIEGFVEVKGVTLEGDGLSKFPDAPTERGRKHVLELIQAKKEGYETSILFLVQMENIKKFRPNSDTDQAFAEALKLARKEGVNILIYNSYVSKDSIVLGEKVEYIG